MTDSPISLNRETRTYQLPPMKASRQVVDDVLGEDEAVPLEVLANSKVCLLIGEPGSGKSHSLQRLNDLILEANPDAAPMLEDLRDHTLHSLEKDLFDVILAEGATPPTHLLLDSLDECRARIDKFVPLMKRRLHSAFAKGIPIIATCRTSELARGILDTFIDLGGHDCIQQLIPLSDTAISQYFASSDLDADQSMTWLESKGLTTLARIPSALRLLTQAAIEQPAMVTDARALYAYAIQRALESESTRNSPSEPSDISSRRRWLAAERTAGLSVLAALSDIWLAETTPQSQALVVHDIVGKEEEGPFTESVDLAALRSVLETELFSQSGPNQRTFLHRSIATYLAASWLKRRQLNSPQLRTLLCGAVTGTRLVPQLREVGAWLVALDPDAYQWIAAADPLALTRAKQVPDSAPVRRAIVDSLVAQASDVYFRLSWNDTLTDLQHSQLASQLKPHILDSERRGYVALRILRDSYVTGLNERLLKVVLDATQPSLHRTIAFDILRNSNDTERLKKVLDATKDGIEADDYRDLLGNILDFAWPKHLDTAQLWSRLRKPRDAYVGGYSMFLSNDLESRMTAEQRVSFVDLLLDNWQSDPKAWDWLLEDDRLMSAIGAHLVDPNSSASIEAAAKLSLLLLNEKHVRVLPVSTKDMGVRRRLVELMLNRSSEPEYLAARLGVAWDASEARFMTQDDFSWALRKAIDPTNDRTEAFARLAASLFDLDNEEHRLELMEANGSPIWHRLEHLADPAYWEELREMAKPTTDPEPAVDLETFVATFDAQLKSAQSDAALFWHPIHLLDVDFAGGYYRSATNVDIRKTAGYQALDSERQNGIVALARQLVSAPASAKLPQADKHDTLYYPLESAYRLLYLLEVTNDPTLGNLSAHAWGEFAEAAIVYPSHFANKEGDQPTKRRLLARIAANAPTQLANALKRALDGAARSKKGWWQLDELQHALVPEVVDVLRRELTERRKPNIQGVLDLLLPLGDEEARAWCAAQLSRAKDVEVLESIISAYFSLSSDLAVSSLTKLHARIPDVGEDVTLKLASHYRLLEYRTPATVGSAADAYEWLYRTFPPEGDPHQEGMAHWVGPREEVANWRDSLLRTLTEHGTSESLAALERLAVRNPEMTLDWSLSRARELAHQSSWDAPSLPQLLRFIESGQRRLISSASDLRDVILEQLAEVQRWLVNENPQAFALWNVSDPPGNPK